MTSKPRCQTITIHILPNISRIKDSQAMKFGQAVEYNKINIFQETSSKVLFVKKGLYEVKASCPQLLF